MTKLDKKNRSGTTLIKTRKHAEFGVYPRSNPRISASKKAFTLLELLIVISIIAILAATIIPNFVGFDAEARLAATKTNLSTIRTRVTLFRTKEGRYPERLEELLEVMYNDLGVERPYLDLIPVEFMSDKGGSSDIENLDSDDFVAGDGGWLYITDKAKVVVDWDMPLDSKWGKAEGQVPIEW